VRPRLDQPPVVGRDRPGRAVGNEAPRRLDGEQVLVGPLLADAVTWALQEGRQVGHGGQQHDTAGALEAGRAIGAAVPMQPTDALQEHVDRGKIGDQQIGIHVERLLERLGRDDQRRPP
jgi:hypothetical protein